MGRNFWIPDRYAFSCTDICARFLCCCFLGHELERPLLIRGHINTLDPSDLSDILFMFPYMVRSLSAVLEEIDVTYETAGRTLGGSRLTVARTITLPLIQGRSAADIHGVHSGASGAVLIGRCRITLPGRARRRCHAAREGEARRLIQNCAVVDEKRAAFALRAGAAHGAIAGERHAPEIQRAGADEDRPAKACRHRRRCRKILDRLHSRQCRKPR